MLRLSKLLALLIALALPASADELTQEAQASEPTAEQEATSEEAEAEQVQVASAPAPVYKPPERGKPRARIGGGVRGTATQWPSLYALVPEHTGQTVSAQPALFWYVDAPVPEGAAILFTLFDDRSVEPLVETQLPPLQAPGIQRIDLAEQGVELAPNTEYEWTIALVVDPSHRSSDIVAAGWIDRVEPPPSLTAAEGAAEGEASAGTYAELGLWYDALEAVSNQLQAEPANAELRASRDALLRQVGLDMAVGTAAAD